MTIRMVLFNENTGKFLASIYTLKNSLFCKGSIFFKGNFSPAAFDRTVAVDRNSRRIIPEIGLAARFSPNEFVRAVVEHSGFLVIAPKRVSKVILIP